MKTCGCEKPTLRLSVTGARVSATHVDTGTVNESALGVALAGAADTYAFDGTTHGSGYFVLGGGQAGFEGALGGALDFGYRIPVDADHGPFGRIGLDGRIQGNDLLYFSMFELPRLTLGWQYLKGRPSSRAARAAICVDAMLFRGDAEMRANAGGIRSTTAQYVGLTVGLASW